jgi:CubicO group peptidase (beta-lactamase class C family)
LRRLFALSLMACCLVEGSALAAPPPLDPALAKRIDAVFADLDRKDSPGCALGVLREGALVYARGYGMANLEHGIPNSPSTVLDIGSVSKQFTAFSIGLLEGEGKLSRDDDIRKLLPEMPAYPDRITIDHLLRHTSGLRDYTAYLSLAGWRTEDLSTADEAFDLIVRQKGVNHRPGHEYLYCNTGYFLLSKIVQRASGQSLRDFAAARIFRPLGMASTAFLDDHTRIVPRRAAGYSPRPEGGFGLDMSDWEQTGDGSVLTSVEDLSRWIANFDTAKVGGPELIRRMQEGVKLADGTPHPYGYGLFMGDYRGLPDVAHTGSWAGYRADTLRFPGESTGLVCLCNLSTAVPSQRTRAVADILLEGRFKTPPPVAKTEAVPSPAPVKAEGPGAPLADYAGLFWSDELQTTYTLATGEGALHIRARGIAGTPLRPVGKDRFVVDDLELAFERDGRGRVRGFRLSQDRIRDLRFTRQSDAAVD